MATRRERAKMRALLAPLDDLAAIGLAWARVMPVVTIVPAFGLRALPTPARGILGLALAAAIYPAVVPVVVAERATPWFVLALEQIVLGLPVALAAAIPLWAATMAGGLVDVLRGSPDGPGLATVEGKPSSFGVLLSLLASVVFLSTGGAARAAGALATVRHAGASLAARGARHRRRGRPRDRDRRSTARGGRRPRARVRAGRTRGISGAGPRAARAAACDGLLAIVAIVMERLATLVATAARSSLPPS